MLPPILSKLMARNAKRGLATSIVDRGVESAISELSDEELADLVELRG